MACAPPLLPDEYVIPGDLVVEAWRGTPGSAFGAALAEEDEILVGAPGLGEVTQPRSDTRSEGRPGLGAWVWWEDGIPYAGRSGHGVYRVDAQEAELVLHLPLVVSFAHGELDGLPTLVTVSPSGLGLWREGERLASHPVEGVHRAAIGFERVLGLRCPTDAPCEVFAWWPETGDEETLGWTSSGGALGEIDGVAWWGDPEEGRPEAPGRACSEAGRCVEGLPGDHLGRSLCEGYAGGVFNPWQVPARARIVALDGTHALAVDRAIESRPLVLHRRGDSLLVGVPSFAPRQADTGRVLRVDVGQIRPDTSR
jgi:hypothetical protein